MDKNSLKLKLVEATVWVRKNPKKVALIVGGVVLVIVVLAIVL
jgi:hypothetical protein